MKLRWMQAAKDATEQQKKIAAEAKASAAAEARATAKAQAIVTAPANKHAAILEKMDVNVAAQVTENMRIN